MRDGNEIAIGAYDSEADEEELLANVGACSAVVMWVA